MPRTAIGCRIRKYRDQDERAVRRCMAALQDFERGLEPRLPPGREMATPYVAYLLRRCAETDGAIFVAEAAGARRGATAGRPARRVVGFVAVFGRVTPEGVDQPPDEYSYVSDLSVLAPYRGRGIGRALLARAEAFAREAGTVELRIVALARNERALGLYRSAGFADQYVGLSKPLGGR